MQTAGLSGSGLASVDRSRRWRATPVSQLVRTVGRAESLRDCPVPSPGAGRAYCARCLSGSRCTREGGRFTRNHHNQDGWSPATCRVQRPTDAPASSDSDTLDADCSVVLPATDIGNLSVLIETSPTFVAFLRSSHHAPAAGQSLHRLPGGRRV